MSTFSPQQLRELSRKLGRQHVQRRAIEGREIDYIEGWFAIAEANAIFGFAGWDRETVHFERVYERTRGTTTSCGYLARVRIRVRAGQTIVLREGTGWGSASTPNPGDAHERALKAAETDATKRALASFGNRFGLCLYDKEQNGVAGPKPAAAGKWTLYDEKRALLADDLSCEAFCGALRQMIEKTKGGPELAALRTANEAELARLRKDAPNLVTPKGAHYADIIEQLVLARMPAAEVPPPAPDASGTEPAPLAPSKIAPGPRIDKSVLEIRIERRLRDKAHLKFVATKPCLVCGRQPSHAHHLTFAQARGLSLKVSDEFAVPLCHAHHDELHRSGSELNWWRKFNLDPLFAASELWRENHPASQAVINAAGPPIENHSSQ